MAGFNYSVSDNVDLYLDWRYRSLSVNHDYGSSFLAYHAKVGDLNEQAVTVGLRWYLEVGPAAASPAAAAAAASPAAAAASAGQDVHRLLRLQ